MKQYDLKLIWDLVHSRGFVEILEPMLQEKGYPKNRVSIQSLDDTYKRCYEDGQGDYAKYILGFLKRKAEQYEQVRAGGGVNP